MAYEEINHLAYLKEARSIFNNGEDDKTRKISLVCNNCGHTVTYISERLEVRGRHDHAFSLYGDIVHLGCFRNAQGCIGVDSVSHGYSWFRGYSWQIQVCGNCYTQLGWKYISQNDSFYGLMLKMLREDGEEEDITLKS